MPQKIKNRIPHTIHAIWLGDPPPQEVLLNLAKWKKINPSYQAKLWIDSSTYADSMKSNDYQHLQEWAKQNNIIICDINLDPKKSDGVVQGRIDLRKSMSSELFYEDEPNGKYRNLAAASDILRLEILYQEGGIYIDARDIFPKRPFSKKFSAHYGFCYHNEAGNINNDVLASIRHGMLIEEYRRKVHSNYKKLYSNEKMLFAHRNPEFTAPQLYDGANPRFVSTLKTSGPGVITHMIEDFRWTHTLIREAGEAITDEKSDQLLQFDNQFFSTPSHGTDLSWIGRHVTYDHCIPILRNYIREYFIKEIEKKSKELACVNQKESLSFFNSNRTLLANLEKIKTKLNTLPVILSIKDIFRICTEDFKEEEITSLNRLS